MNEGILYKSISGFYYVESGSETIRCRARGRFRHEDVSPLVGDRVEYALDGDGTGIIEKIQPRINQFVRPPVANIEVLVIVASAVIPVTAPFLIDRIAAIAEQKSCEPIICINKADMNSADELYGIYSASGFTTIRTSALSGEGMAELIETIRGKICAFTGNSGVGKSSILNRIEPDFHIAVGEVSDRLGRGRHTTRHVELYKLSCGALVADTPGFSSFDTEQMELTEPERIQHCFREFAPFIGSCRFRDCSHTSELGCSVIGAVDRQEICRSRHESYCKLYEQARQYNKWDKK